MPYSAKHNAAAAVIHAAALATIVCLALLSTTPSAGVHAQSQCNGLDSFSCMSQAGCGWCISRQRCEYGSYNGSIGNSTRCTGTKWVFTSCGEYVTEDACVAYSTCGWCPTNAGTGLATAQCVRGNSSGPIIQAQCAAGEQYVPPNSVADLEPKCRTENSIGEPNEDLIANGTTGSSCVACVKYGCKWCKSTGRCGGACDDTISNEVQCPDFVNGDLQGGIAAIATLVFIHLAAGVGIHRYIIHKNPEFSELLTWMVMKHPLFSMFYAPPTGETAKLRMFREGLNGGLQFTATFIALMLNLSTAATAGVAAGVGVVFGTPINWMLKCTGEAPLNSCKRIMGNIGLCLCVVQFMVLIAVFALLATVFPILPFPFINLILAWLNGIFAGWTAAPMKLLIMHFTGVGVDKEEKAKLYITVSKAAGNNGVLCCCKDDNAPDHAPPPQAQQQQQQQQQQQNGQAVPMTQFQPQQYGGQPLQPGQYGYGQPQPQPQQPQQFYGQPPQQQQFGGAPAPAPGQYGYGQQPAPGQYGAPQQPAPGQYGGGAPQQYGNGGSGAYPPVQPQSYAGGSGQYPAPQQQPGGGQTTYIQPAPAPVQQPGGAVTYSPPVAQ